MQYCIYTNEYLCDDDMNVEHIIPLSLGGHDKFTISVGKKANSFLGSKVDGRLINELTMKLKQIHEGYNGHSKKSKFRLKNCKSDGKPINVTFKKGGMIVYDPINKKVLNESLQIETKTQIELDTCVKFVSKVALATGYYIFGNLFIDHADHQTLRNIIFTKGVLEDHHDIKYYDRFSQPKEEDKQDLDFVKFLFKNIKGSGVLFSFSDQSFIVHVGIGGDYIGMVNFKADIDRFPVRTDDFRLGHVIICDENGLYRDSYWKTIYHLNKKLNLVDIDDSLLDI